MRSTLIMSKDASDFDPASELASLPDDPALLKRIILARGAQLADRDSQLADRDSQLADRDVLIARIREEASAQLETELAALRARLEAEKRAEIAALLRRYYRPKSERFNPSQLLLFGQLVAETPVDREAVAEQAGSEPSEEAVAPQRKKKHRHRHGRGPLPEQLPRIPIEHDLTDEAKKCPGCGEVRCRIGREVSEQLERIPSRFQVLQHIRHQYGCPRCEGAAVNPRIETAAKPKQPIEKGLPGPALLAYLVTSKFGDHLPLYRLEKIFAREGVSIPRATMCGWEAKVGELVRPIVELMARRVLQSLNIHCDDTTVPVQAPGKGKCRTGRLWCYLGDRRHPYVVYEYRPDRKRDGPAHWLRDYRGYLQADAYGGFDGIYAGGLVTEVACWAHARRKFFDLPETDPRRAWMLGRVRALYAIEDEARALDDAARWSLRRERSVPLLDEIKSWLDAESQVVLPRSAVAGAIGYALNQWTALTVYTTQGYLDIDNNAAERAMRRVAIGRKNWLFAGNDYFGGVAARFYSLIASAERCGIDPQAYLRSLFADLPTTPASHLDELLPDAWARREVAAASAP